MYWCSSGSLPHGLGGTRNPSFPHFFSLLASTRGDALKEELTDLQRPLLSSPPLRSRCRGKLPSAHGDGTDLQVSDISPICFIVSLSSLPSYHRHGRLHALSSACRLHASPPSPRVTSMLAQAECHFIKTKWALRLRIWCSGLDSLLELWREDCGAVVEPKPSTAPSRPMG